MNAISSWSISPRLLWLWHNLHMVISTHYAIISSHGFLTRLPNDCTWSPHTSMKSPSIKDHLPFSKRKWLQSHSSYFYIIYLMCFVKIDLNLISMLEEFWVVSPRPVTFVSLCKWPRYPKQFWLFGCSFQISTQQISYSSNVIPVKNLSRRFHYLPLNKQISLRKEEINQITVCMNMLNCRASRSYW